MERRKVILIGGDDHNILGVVRSFGINGIKPYGVIISEKKKDCFTRYSKYWENNWIVSNENEALDLLLEIFSKENHKPVVILCSDGMARLVDLERKKLEKYFILPSIGEETGALARLMNKKVQVEFARDIGIKMIDSYVVDISDIDRIAKPDCYPVILKPVTSVEGKKLDIQICYGENEYESICKKLNKIGYTRILYQKYLEKCTEYVVVGAVSPCNEFSSYTVLKNLRCWPIECGTGSYSIYVLDEKIINYVSELFAKLIQKGVNTPIDVEIFEDENGDLYVNEFNWRCSGRNFICLDNKNFSALQWYMNSIGVIEENGCRINRTQGYSINEATDLRYVFFEKMSLFKWMKDLNKANSYAVWYSKDLRPTVVRYIYLLKQILKI